MKRLILSVLLLAFLIVSGCMATEAEAQAVNQTEKTSEPAQQQEKQELYSAKSIIDGDISACKVFTAQDVEELFALGPGNLEHISSGIALPGMITVRTCEYDTLEQSPSSLAVKMNKFENATYMDFIWNGSVSDTINGYEYKYAEATNENTTIAKSIRVLVPDSMMTIEVVVFKDFTSATDETLYSAMELLLSRIDFTDESPHQLSPSSEEKITYVGGEFSFEYPENWLVSESYKRGMMVEDPDGILMFIVGPMNADPLYSKENGTAEFNAQVDMMEDTEILESSVTESEDTRRYMLAVEENEYVSLICYIQSLEEPSPPDILAMGILIDERYSFYKEDIEDIVSSIRVG